MASITRRRASPKATRPSAEDQFLAAAERLLAKGRRFTTLSIEDLATEAGVSRASFYLHFRDKGDLVARLAGRVRDEVMTSVALWLRSSDRLTREQVRDAMRGYVGVIRKHHPILVAARETSSYDPVVRELLDGVVDELGKESRRALSRLRRSGRAHPDVTPHAIQVLTWAVYDAAVHFAARADAKEIERLVETLTHVCWSAIFAPEPRSGRGRS